MNRKLGKGDGVIIELKPLEIWEGTVEYDNEKYIEISSGKKEDHEQTTNLTFSKRSIVSISRIGDEKCDFSNSTRTNSVLDTTLESSISINEHENERVAQPAETVVCNGIKAPQNSQIEPGDVVVIHTKDTGTFKGQVEQILKNSLELTNVICHETGAELDMLSFKNHEIKSFNIIAKNETAPQPVIPANGTTKKIKIPQSEFERLKTMVNKFVYLKKTDQELSDALYDLDNSETIGIAALGSTFNKTKPLSLILMCNFNTVYIFDVACLSITKDLKNLLQADYIMKVAHDITPISHFFHHKFNLKIQNVFDTQVADTWLTQKGTGKRKVRDLSECLAHHFNFPPSLVSDALEEMDDCNWDECQRPFTRKSGKLNRASQLVVYLLTLKEHLMRLMLKDYYRTVEAEIVSACERV